MSDIRNIRPFGTIPPDKIKRVINGKLTEIKKAYRCINGKLVVVWDIGDTPEPPAANEFILVYNPTESSGAYWANVPQIEEVGESHAGTIDWGDGTVEPFWSNNGKNHNYGKPGIYTVTINCPIEKIRSVSYGSAVFLSKDIISVKFPNTLKEIGRDAFYYNKLNSIDFAAVEQIGAYAFHYGSGNLQELYGEKVKNIGREAFYRIEKIEKIDFPECEIINLRAFRNCSAMKTARLPRIKFIGSEAFASCYNIESIELSNCVEYIAYYHKGVTDYDAFSNCSNLKQIIIHMPKDSIAGAPWGATNATVIWTG